MFTLKKPKFWEVEGFIAHVLLPLSMAYFLYLRFINLFKKRSKLSANIICIGNAVAGGAGKTPTAIKFYHILKNQYPHVKFAFITKGYKGKQKKPVKISDDMPAKLAGDESILLAAHAATYVGKSRIQTIKKAISDGFDFLILDDGLHDNNFQKDVSVLVIDGGYGLGNYMPMPSGPLRDRFDFAANKPDMVIIIGKDEKNVSEFIKRKLKKDTPVIMAEFISSQKPDTDKYLAFAGIGRPQKFFDSLKNNGFNTIRTIEYEDHYNYTIADEKNLLKLSEELSAKIITTEKDYVKLSPGFRSQLAVLKIDLDVSEVQINNLVSAKITS